MVTLNHFTQCFFFLEIAAIGGLKQNAPYMYIGRFRHFIYSFFHSIFSLVIVNKLIFFSFTLKKVVMLNSSKEPVGHSQTTPVFVKN